MTSAGQNFTVYRGQDQSVVVSITGVSDLSGATAEWRVLRLYNGPILLRKQTGSGVVLDNGAMTATISIADTDLSGAEGVYRHELWITDNTGNVTPLTVGELMVKTRAGQ